jgi:hypothetical protein
MTKDTYTDKRTGIVYKNVNADVDAPAHKQAQAQAEAQEIHLDAFIPDAFLKTYFGKSKLGTASI